MHINTHVVRALMALRGITEPTLANIANVTPSMLSKWLHDATDGDEIIAFDTQLEILRVLGINGEAPRQDIVHYWHIHQDFFTTNKAFWAIDVITEAFGKAEVVYFAQDTDPLATVTARAHFGFQFQSFKAVLEVTTHPLRNIGFDPSNFENLAWAEGSALVLVNREQFEKLAPGLMTPALYTRQLTLGREQLAWERLNSLSRETKIGPEQLEMLLQNVQQGLLTPQLTSSTEQDAGTAIAPPIEMQPARSAAAAARATASTVTPTVVTESPAPTAAVTAARDDVPAAPSKVPPVAVPPVAPAPAAVAQQPESVIDLAAATMGQQFVPRARRRDARPRPLRAVPNTGTGSR
jgi:transcriptional regulator with XRE-family HTH domain